MSSSMESRARTTARIEQLTAGRVPFVRATVVRAQIPTSAAPGDTAIVLEDGSIDGFVGGQCAETSVRVAAGDVLAAGQPMLLRILPGDDDSFPDTPGARTVVNPCLSGGAVEIFLEPVLPAPLIAICGTSPIAEAVAALTKQLDYEVERTTSIVVAPGTIAVVVATHGHDETAWIRAALDAGVGFIGVVASPKRGRAVIEELDLTDAERERVHTPLGVWIGAKTADEIALSILAEIVRAIRLDGLRPARVTPCPEPVAFVPAGPAGHAQRDVGPLITAIDPICGMTVVASDTTPSATVNGEQHWFCCTGCRDRFVAATA